MGYLFPRGFGRAVFDSFLHLRHHHLSSYFRGVGNQKFF
nr:MAG TPA: hypothetical protein [Bacteriophage sp.]